MKVSQSKIKVWRKCHQMYNYRYVMRLKRKMVKRPLMFGRIVHEVVEAYINGDDPFEVIDKISFDQEKLFTAEREMYGEIIEDMRLIMRGYFEHWPERNLKFLRVNKRNAEHTFDIEIAPDIILTGKIDAIADSPNKNRWLVEHKSFTRLPTDDHRWRNLQSAVYIRVVDMLGWFKRGIDGTLWDYIHSKPPTIPNILKNGTQLSSASVATVLPAVMDEIERLGLKKKDNEKVIAMAKESEKQYFIRIFTPVKPKVVDYLFASMIDTARDIAENGETKTDMNPDTHCEWCDFEPLCRARMMGNDYDSIIEREYTIHADPEKEPVVEGD